ncbi:nuclear transport factor 2 family protein [Alteraurantiacibacter aquimixticola]|nr:nuclear transport factor 2 family protein [Alteraurantiacibacter aquimixticola]
MTPEQRLLIEQACGKLPLLFAHYADIGDHAALKDLFTADGTYDRPFQPGYPFHGRDAIQSIFRDRPPILVRHIVTNVLVEVVSETKARGTNYVTMLSNHANTEMPQEAGGIFVGGFADEYVLDAGTWRFASRAGHLALHQGGTIPAFPPPTDEARGLK